jgi:T4 RnlA family RNA ligase
LLVFVSGDFKSEVEQLVRLNYTVDMEYTSPSNHIVVSYSESKLTVLSIRSHADGQTLFGTQLKTFLLENHLLAILSHLVPFESIPSNVTHKQLLNGIAQESYGEGYVVQIIQPDQSSYLVKIKTQRYLMTHRDGQPTNSTRSLFEAIINEQADDLRGLFQDDTEALKSIEEMEQNIRPKYNRMIEVIEQFYRTNKHLPKKDFVRSITKIQNMTIYLPLLMNLYTENENDYKGFAMKHAKDLFGIHGAGN